MHFHVAPFDHATPGDNGVCRCAQHALKGTPRVDACTYECHMCARAAVIAERIAERGNGSPLRGEEKARKAALAADSLAQGGCGCGNYAPSALKAFDRAGVARPALIRRSGVAS